MGFMGSELQLVSANAYIVRSPENFQMFDQFNSTFQPYIGKHQRKFKTLGICTASL